MTEYSKSKQYDLEDRTLLFAKNVRTYINKISRSISNIEYSKQLIRSSGSVGANYIEANEAFSKKDFVMRIKICRKEAKESRYWLELTESQTRDLMEKKKLVSEATELLKIFNAIVVKSR